MNPIPYKDAAQVIRGFHRSESTLPVIHERLAFIGKKAIVVNDDPGFVSNPISHLFMNETYQKYQ